MLEKTIEQELVNQVKKRGGICPKWVSPSFAGVPDRLVFLPDGKFGMVEVKRPKGKPRVLQMSRHKLLNKLGFTVYVLDSLEQIGGILDAIEST
ncbi:VRR-NUC domain-containing protein [Streptococcus cristatus]|uniref:VRR-NUC domain-containing protein n=1 Tax=Streptococcus cristatus TaxID=45634 RepID=UPI001EF2D31E|nr:VRR-NUC domain-containing protein [Streptococcus cristatus]MCG7329928.1 VRR-NUC domain-containing protein [Streptococcus cristatus]